VGLGALFRSSWRDVRAARQQDSSYRQIWQAFRQYSHVADGRHDTPDWRGHDGVFAACAIRVPAGALQPALDELREALSTYQFVRLHPDHFLHLMLQEIGFVCAEPKKRDEWSAGRLEEYATAASSAVAEATPFELRLGGANSFQDAAFLDVHDRGACARLHSRLHDLAAVPVVPRFAYLPHTTIAHYTEEATIGNLPATIARFRDERFGTFLVEQIEIVTLRVDEPYPELETYAVMQLSG
jgi:RNA 2',3'-cyclic 3'-phosphodiesterase